MGWADTAVCVCSEGQQSRREKRAGEAELEKVFQ